MIGLISHFLWTEKKSSKAFLPPSRLFAVSVV
jgi:hypothetical protein